MDKQDFSNDHEQRISEKNALWQRFILSGRIDDYMAYTRFSDDAAGRPPADR